MDDTTSPEVLAGNLQKTSRNKTGSLAELAALASKHNFKTTSSMIGAISIHAYRLGLTPAETYRFLQAHFRKNGEYHRAPWAKRMIKGAREYAQKLDGQQEVSSL